MCIEPRISAYDVGFLTKSYFIETQKALLNNPKAENIHFLINSHNANIKVDVPVRERWHRYESHIKIALVDIRELVTDPDLFTATVLTRLYNEYKKNLVVH